MSRIEIEDIGETKLISLEGQFIGDTETDALRDTLTKLAKDGNQKLIINLEKTTYMNSTALGVMISAHAGYAKRNGKFVLCNLGDSLLKIFEMTKLTQVFPVCDNIEKATHFVNN